MKTRGRYSKSDVETVKTMFYSVSGELKLGLRDKFDDIKNDIIFMDEGGLLKTLNKKTLAVIYCMLSHNELNNEYPSLSNPLKFPKKNLKIFDKYVDICIPEKIKLEFKENKENIKEIKIKQIATFYRYLNIIDSFNTFGRSEKIKKYSDNNDHSDSND